MSGDTHEARPAKSLAFFNEQGHGAAAVSIQLHHDLARSNGILKYRETEAAAGAFGPVLFGGVIFL
jgi:hypothetical protein